MKRVILELVDTFDNNKVYFTEVPKIFKKHYVKKYEKHGYLVTDWADFLNDLVKGEDIEYYAKNESKLYKRNEETEKLEEDNDNHIPFI